MPTVPIVAAGKEQRTKMGRPGFLIRQTPYSNYLEVAGGLSAVSAFGTQLLRDLINLLGLTRWRLTGQIDSVAENGRSPVSKYQILVTPWVWIMSGLARGRLGEGKNMFPVQLTLATIPG